MSIKRTTELDRTRTAYLKAARTAIRLKYSLMADAEISEFLPALEDRINQALATGSPLELSVGQIFDEV